MNLLAVGLGSFAVFLFAASPGAALADPQPVEAHAASTLEARARAFLELTRYRHRLRASVEAQMRAADFDPGDSDGSDPAVRDAFVQALLHAYDAVAERFFERQVRTVAETYTLEELKALEAFYATPAGRSIALKLERSAPLDAELSRDLYEAIFQEYGRQLCERGQCGSAGER